VGERRGIKEEFVLALVEREKGLNPVIYISEGEIGGLTKERISAEKKNLNLHLEAGGGKF